MSRIASWIGYMLGVGVVFLLASTIGRMVFSSEALGEAVSSALPGAVIFAVVFGLWDARKFLKKER